MKSLTFGERLTNYRKLRNMSQETLAELCGVSLATISRWETNDMHPRPHNLEKLSEVLHIDTASFYDSSDFVLPENIVVRECAFLLESLSSEEQMFVLQCLREFVKLCRGVPPNNDSV